MGWWKDPKNPDVTLGDVVLDLARHFLDDIHREYRSGLSRKPTLEELQQVLTVSFGVNLRDELVSGLEGRVVSGVAIKTVKRSGRTAAPRRRYLRLQGRQERDFRVWAFGGESQRGHGGRALRFFFAPTYPGSGHIDDMADGSHHPQRGDSL